MGTTTLAAGAGNDITLDSVGNNFSTVGITSGRNVTLIDSNALNLAASTISGSLNVTTAGAITDSGNLNVTGTTTLAAGAGNDITLNSIGNNFSTVAITSGRNVTLVDSNALDLGASNVSGALNLTAGGAVTESGALNITGSTSLTATAANTDILLNTQPNNFGGGVTFAGTQSNFRDIGLRNTNAGAVVPVLSGLTNLRNLDLIHDNAGVTLPTLNAAGAMNVIAGGTITQSGNVNVTGITTLNSGASDITLGNAGNNFSTVVVSSGNNVVLRDINALDLGASTISGTLSVTTAGALTDSGNLSVTGTTTLAAGAGNDVILDSAGNNFSTVAITSGRNVTLVDSNALDLGTSTVAGTLNVTTGGALTQSGAVTVPGTTTVAAGAANNITLNNGANDFSTVGITSGNNISLADANALDLGTSTISGNLNVATAGVITDSGNLNVTGTTTLAAGAGNDITLDSAANNFSTVAITSGRNVTLVDSNALDLGASTVSGTLNVTTNGALTQSGPVVVAGATTLAAGAGDITLNNAANDFNTIGITSANNVTLQDRNDISLTSSTVAGNFSLTAGGAILDGDGSAINITATIANLIGASNIGTVVDPLETSVGMLNGSTTGGGIFVSEANAVILGNISAGGGNDIVISNTSGNMTVNSVTTAGGAVTLASPGGAIQDGNGGSNNVTAHNLTVSSSNGVDLDTSVSTLTSANVTGVGSIDISNIGALTVTSATTANGNIALNATGGDLAITTVTAGGSGGNVTLSTTTSGAVLLGAVSAPNTVAVNSAGAIADTNGGTNNITAVTANLVAVTNIGASVDPIETTVGTLNATTTVGGIFISEADAITLGNVSAGGGNSVVISNTTGDMRVDSVTAVGATVSLTAPGGGILDGNGSANNVTANSLAVVAATGIGLDTTINALTSASVTGAGSINVSNNGSLSVANATTTNGSIALSATSGDLDITSVNAGGAGAGVTLSTTTSGNVNLGFVTAPDQVTITSAGAITDGNGAANNITTATTSLSGATNIGTTPDPLETAVQTLNATATAGGISITEADRVTLNNIVAGGGNVTISNTAGDMIINSITASAGGIDLTASAGSILDGNGAANNLTAVADSNLRALGGVIGLSTDPIEVSINPGLLGVAATGQVGGVSVDINGTVLPSGALTLLNSPPGEVIFNSRVLNPSPVNLPNLTGIAAELNPQRVNEDNYFTELLLDVLGEDFFKAQPFYCKLDDSLQVKLDSNLCTEDDR
jgi:trimeric autotransporter adhesin